MAKALTAWQVRMLRTVGRAKSYRREDAMCRRYGFSEYDQNPVSDALCSPEERLTAQRDAAEAARVRLAEQLGVALSEMGKAEARIQDLQTILSELIDATRAGDDLLGRDKAKLKAIVRRAKTAGLDVDP